MSKEKRRRRNKNRSRAGKRASKWKQKKLKALREKGECSTSPQPPAEPAP